MSFRYAVFPIADEDGDDFLVCESDPLSRIAGAVTWLVGLGLPTAAGSELLSVVRLTTYRGELRMYDEVSGGEPVPAKVRRALCAFVEERARAEWERPL